MNTRWKIFIAILIFLWVDAAAAYIIYTKPWTGLGQKISLMNPLAKTSSSQQNTSTKTYSNKDMHLSFQYPSGLQVTEVRSHLLSIENTSSTSVDSTLYIFETTASNHTKTVDIPFVIKGKLKSETPIPVHDFTAKQLTYTDGLTLLTLQKDQQFIMVRIPKDSKNVEDAITDFVDSVKLLE